MNRAEWMYITGTNIYIRNIWVSVFGEFFQTRKLLRSTFFWNRQDIYRANVVMHKDA